MRVGKNKKEGIMVQAQTRKRYIMIKQLYCKFSKKADYFSYFFLTCIEPGSNTQKILNKYLLNK